MQKQQTESQSIFQQAENLRRLMVFPALTIMVYLRRDIGYRLAKPGWLFGMGFLVWMIAGLFPDHTHPRELSSFMTWYAWGIPLFGILHRGKAWVATRKGKPWHSYSSGISHLQYFLPLSFNRYSVINRFLDPLFVAFVALFVWRYISVVFAYWLFFGAFGLFWYEQDEQEKAVERDLDIADGFIVADVQSETARHFEPSKRAAGHSAAGGPKGIPTGLGADIHRRG